jgi:phosphatidylinositol N-acetylglucosaminyltransferase subunit A
MNTAQVMGIRTCFTDHSLFGFNDLASILMNKVMKWKLALADASICVSHANKDNLTLRAALNPMNVYVIPNSVDTTKFTPNPGLRYPVNTINIVVICRLTFRKGVDLLVDVIPEVLRKHPNVHFIVGGDGPKMQILREMRDKYNITDKVELLGSLPHSEVRKVLCRGHIFLNTSLTEAFCIAILEAASCGLLCVSTNVGGIPEVLPPDMIYMAPARPKPLIEQLEMAIKNYKNIPCTKMHETVKNLYSWHNVAERTERVYFKV